MNETLKAMYLMEGYTIARESIDWSKWKPVVDENRIAIMSINFQLTSDGWGMPYSEVNSYLEQFANSEKVKAIVISINSPGGEVAGLFDCCRYIQKVSKKKKCVAYVTGRACSAAYAIASSCDAIYLAEDAEVGSCGCYAHPVSYGEDFYKKEGFIHRVFRSKVSPRKNVSVITDEAEANAFQAEVDALGEKYLHFVAENRGKTYEYALEHFGQGGTLSGEDAINAGMADEVCPIEDVIEKLKTINTTSSPVTIGSEGEAMDINAMSAEERRTLFTQLCSIEPTLMAGVEKGAVEKERGRIKDLNALRDGSDAINAIVDAAVADGKESSDIYMDVIKAMRDGKKEEKKEKGNALEALFEDTTIVTDPKKESYEDQMKEIVSLATGKGEKR